jgi:hypothetical protein
MLLLSGKLLLVLLRVLRVVLVLSDVLCSVTEDGSQCGSGLAGDADIWGPILDDLDIGLVNYLLYNFRRANESWGA